ncbi:helix-turn-helix domain-containing protein [Stappia sp. GBMRC 2046]|uniref:Helix-turn-helix domain-containing protein n=1 Tax=Stappia sediminis TaxID=2692190 RepID=A0A7X3LXF8_9HYPH|nr:IclR family transcriptional regulator [Stappia sediminis]MXN66897.1 helix-turn-helix domain-containing protein [Stappia sediminis]
MKDDREGRASDKGTAAEAGVSIAGDLSSPISKAFFLLDAMAASEGQVRFSDLQRASGFPKATLHRLLRQLEHEGMVIHDVRAQRYRLGLRLIRLAHGAWQDASLAQVGGPYVEGLSAELGMTVHLGCLENGQVLYLDKRNRIHGIEMFSRPGRIGPAYCTGIGKAMLASLSPERLREALDRQAFHRHTPKTIADRAALEAELAKIRERGYAFDDEEHEPSIICVAVPILSREKALIGGLSVTTTTNAGSPEKLEAAVPSLKETAHRIARAAEIQFLDR